MLQMVLTVPPTYYITVISIIKLKIDIIAVITPGLESKLTHSKLLHFERRWCFTQLHLSFVLGLVLAINQYICSFFLLFLTLKASGHYSHIYLWP